MSLDHPFRKLFSFWIFLILFRISNVIYYASLSVLGMKVFNSWEVGLILGLATFIQLPFDLLVGNIMKKTGYLKIIQISAISTIISALILISGLSQISFIISVIFSIASWLFFLPGLNAYILSFSDKTNAGKYIMLKDAVQSIGIVIGTTTLPFLININTSNFGIIISSLILFSLLFTIFAKKDQARLHEEEKRLSTQAYYVKTSYFKDIYKTIDKLNPASWMLLFQGLASNIFYSAIWFTVPLAIANNSRNLHSASLGVFDAAIIFLGFIFGYISRKFNRRLLIISGLLMFGLMASLIGFYDGFVFLLFGFLATTGDELSNISLWAWLGELSPDHTEDSTIASIITFFQDLGWSIGPILAGFFYYSLGFSFTTAITAIPIILVWILAIQKTYHLSFRSLHINHHAKPHRRRHL